MHTTSSFIKIKWLIFLWLVAGISLSARAQDSLSKKMKPPKKKISLHDSLDHAIDFSDFMIDANGFIPIPILITEPAIGIGGAIAPVLLRKRQQPASYKKHKNMAAIPPDITGGFAFYTANKSWGAGAGRSGTIIPWGMRYKAFAAYINLNMDFYKTLPVKGETEFGVNLKSIPVFLQVQKQLGFSNWHAGIRYMFIKTTAKLEKSILPDSLFKPKEMDNLSSIAGVLVEYDKRDNEFTPGKGTKMHVGANFSSHIFGSDFDYTNIEAYAYHYIPIGNKKKWVCGLRADMQQVFGDIPFYFKPSIDLRGIPKGRYQGNVNMLIETEQRWNIVRRWSAVFFTGVGKAFDEYADFGSASWDYSYGTGFRYLLARKFGVYMGADIARGPEQWGFYIQFGSAWLK
ncbi:BamA/TamA family outer membrane protein [Chitinophaga sp. ARDCPP14]|uniref:BamA/TamA family outer membrane protein n=1 Tax=Chitinophaga sp. ARDCPP14 TaxID=3391139 RepID=UPI003F520638